MKAAMKRNMKAAMKKGQKHASAKDRAPAKKATKKVTIAAMSKQLGEIRTYVEAMAKHLSEVQCDVLDVKKLVKNPRAPPSPPPQMPIPRRLALPHGWEEHYSDMWKCPYYFNVETGNSMWQHPSL